MACSSKYFKKTYGVHPKLVECYGVKSFIVSLVDTHRLAIFPEGIQESAVAILKELQHPDHCKPLWFLDGTYSY